MDVGQPASPATRCRPAGGRKAKRFSRPGEPGPGPAGPFKAPGRAGCGGQRRQLRPLRRPVAHNSVILYSRKVWAHKGRPAGTGGPAGRTKAAARRGVFCVTKKCFPASRNCRIHNQTAFCGASDGIATFLSGDYFLFLPDRRPLHPVFLACLSSPWCHSSVFQLLHSPVNCFQYPLLPSAGVASLPVSRFGFPALRLPCGGVPRAGYIGVSH